MIIALGDALANTTIPADSCRNVAKRFEIMSNIHPSKLAEEAPRTLALLKNGETPNYYFIAYNIYVENLFNQGRITEARREIRKMLADAIKQGDNECVTVARRAEGQFFYKIGLYNRAADYFRKGMTICPDYKRLRSYFTYSSTATWLAQTDIRIGRLEEAKVWLGKVSEMMKWLDEQKKSDKSGHNQVRSLALQALVKIEEGGNGNISEARQLLKNCEPYILPQLPFRAYIDYYEAQMRLSIIDKDYGQAVALLDTLISVHRHDYRPICLNFIRQKANILYDIGKTGEAAGIYKQYIEQRKEVEDIAIARELDELRTEHEVDILNQSIIDEKAEKRLIGIACLLLLVIVICIATSYILLRRKNNILVGNIRQREYEQEKEKMLEQQKLDAEGKKFAELGEKIVELLNTTECYCEEDYGRAIIKERLGINDRTITLALNNAVGVGLTAFANKLRLDHSIRLMKDSPNLSISQIAERCGFSTVRSFQRQFKTTFGISPSTYRNHS